MCVLDLATFRAVVKIDLTGWLLLAMIRRRPGGRAGVYKRDTVDGCNATVGQDFGYDAAVQLSLMQGAHDLMHQLKRPHASVMFSAVRIDPVR